MKIFNFIVLTITLLSTSSQVFAAGAKLHTHRCALDIQELRAEYGLFISSGATREEAVANVIDVCKNTVRDDEDRVLCGRYTSEDDTHLVCQYGAVIPF